MINNTVADNARCLKIRSFFISVSEINIEDKILKIKDRYKRVVWEKKDKTFKNIFG
jgi:hypothetical protein